jgi:hypothetical protein
LFGELWFAVILKKIGKLTLAGLYKPLALRIGSKDRFAEYINQ